MPQLVNNGGEIITPYDAPQKRSERLGQDYVGHTARECTASSSAMSDCVKRDENKPWPANNNAEILALAKLLWPGDFDDLDGEIDEP